MAKAKSRKRPKQRAWQKTTRKIFSERHAVSLLVGALVLLGLTTYLSNGAGRTGNPSAGKGGFTGSDFHSLVADPQVQGRLYAGGHEAVSVSDDSGTSWRQIESLDGADAMGWGFAENATYLAGHPGLSISADGAKPLLRATAVSRRLTYIHLVQVGACSTQVRSPACWFQRIAHKRGRFAIPRAHGRSWVEFWSIPSSRNT